MKQKAFYILRIVVFTAVILSFVATAILYAQEPDQTVAGDADAVPAQTGAAAMWDEGNEAYNNREYARAISLYEAVLAEGKHSARLYYNLGNACFKADDLAHAILYYKRALLLSPSDEDTRYNLSLAEAQTKDRIAVVPEFFLKGWMRGVRDALGCTAWSALSICMFAAALALLLTFLLGRSLPVRKAGFYGTVAATLLFVATTAFAVSSRERILSHDEAVVMASAVAIKSSPDGSATELFVLHAGTSVRVIGEVDEWREIVIADGKRGWVESKNIEVI